MNKDAEAEIERLVWAININNDNDIDGCSLDMDSAQAAVRAAMAWAYQDAARVCREEATPPCTDPIDLINVGYNMAIKHCTAAIEARAKA